MDPRRLPGKPAHLLGHPLLRQVKPARQGPVGVGEHRRERASKVSVKRVAGGDVSAELQEHRRRPPSDSAMGGHEASDGALRFGATQGRLVGAEVLLDEHDGGAAAEEDVEVGGDRRPPGARRFFPVGGVG